ncbi:hypothetical protein ACFV00_15290 [Streptomyces californicus]|uniref:hypothetical protein n=1 Tax=Streptomyces californicus TaxID=67351 RepID=UPI0036927C38
MKGNLVAGILAFAVTVAAYVVLTVKGQETGGLLALATPVIGALLIVSRVDARSDAQDQALTQITRQTNGVLTQRITDGVDAALTKRFGPPAP